MRDTRVSLSRTSRGFASYPRLVLASSPADISSARGSATAQERHHREHQPEAEEREGQEGEEDDDDDEEEETEHSRRLLHRHYFLQHLPVPALGKPHRSHGHEGYHTADGDSSARGQIPSSHRRTASFDSATSSNSSFAAADGALVANTTGPRRRSSSSSSRRKRADSYGLVKSPPLLNTTLQELDEPPSSSSSSSGARRRLSSSGSAGRSSSSSASSSDRRHQQPQQHEDDEMLAHVRLAHTASAPAAPAPHLLSSAWPRAGSSKLEDLLDDECAISLSDDQDEEEDDEDECDCGAHSQDDDEEQDADEEDEHEEQEQARATGVRIEAHVHDSLASPRSPPLHEPCPWLAPTRPCLRSSTGALQGDHSTPQQQQQHQVAIAPTSPYAYRPNAPPSSTSLSSSSHAVPSCPSPSRRISPASSVVSFSELPPPRGRTYAPDEYARGGDQPVAELSLAEVEELAHVRAQIGVWSGKIHGPPPEHQHHLDDSTTTTTTTAASEGSSLPQSSDASASREPAAPSLIAAQSRVVRAQSSLSGSTDSTSPPPRGRIKRLGLPPPCSSTPSPSSPASSSSPADPSRGAESAQATDAPPASASASASSAPACAARPFYTLAGVMGVRTLQSCRAGTGTGGAAGATPVVESAPPLPGSSAMLPKRRNFSLGLSSPS